MVIYDFDFVDVFAFPTKAEAPLVIDANAVLAAALAFKRLQAVAGRKAHDVESVGGIELEEFSSGSALDVGRQVTRSRAAEEFFCLGVGEAFDHGTQRRRSRGGRKPNSYVRRNGLGVARMPRAERTVHLGNSRTFLPPVLRFDVEVGQVRENGVRLWVLDEREFLTERGVRGARPRGYLAADFVQIVEMQRRAEPAVRRGRAI